MTTTPSPAYKKFRAPGAMPRGFGVIPSKITAWFGEDHLLLLKRTGFLIDLHESYRRLYYGDIRGVSLERTASWLWRAVLNGVIALALAAFGIWLWSEETSRQVPVFIIYGIALFPFCKAVLALMRGPSCIFRIHTAVQVEEVPCLGWLNKAHQFIDELRPRIEAAQGTLPVEQILSQATGQTVAASTSGTSVHRLPPRIPEKKVASLWAYQAFYALLLIGAPIKALSLFQQATWVFLLASLLSMVRLVLLICVMVIQVQGGVPALLKKITWVVAIYCFITLFIMWMWQIGYGFKYGLEHPGYHVDQWAMIKEMHHYLVTGNGWYKNFKMVDIFLSVLAGTIGLILSFRGAPAPAQPPPAAPPAP